MNTFRADMHCHSTCSDGSLTPVQLVELAATNGLKGLSITDHDSIDAYPTAIPAAQQLGIDLISGVEFSTILGEASIHVLGYAFSVKEPLIHTFCGKHQVCRDDRNREILRLLSKHGMPIAEEELKALAKNPINPTLITTIGRPHIAQLMVKKGYVTDMREAFNKYIGENCRCYAKGDFFSPEETIEVIQNSKGLAFIAHPHLVNGKKVIDKLLKMNFDGIECYYSKFHAASHARWITLAQNRGWLISGGSDFHGDVKPTVSLGCSWIDETHFNPIRERYLANEASTKV